MDPIKIDLSIIARDLKLVPENVEQAVALLDNGNTIPFITRFRKDLTGGLNEQQLLAIQDRVARLRALRDRKATILRSVASQEGVTDAIKLQIQQASSGRQLEELYQPFKTKKQSRATVARQQGLAPLADEILSTIDSQIDFATRATDFVRVDKGLNSVDEVIKGVGDLIAEKFSRDETLRGQLRKLFHESATLESQWIEKQPPQSTDNDQESSASDTPAQEATPSTAAASTTDPPAASSSSTTCSPSTASPTAITDKEPTESKPVATSAAVDSPTPSVADVNLDGAKVQPAPSESTSPAADASRSSDSSTETPSPPTDNVATVSESVTAQQLPAADVPAVDASASAGEPAKSKKKKKNKKKNKKKEKQAEPFKEFAGLSQPIKKLPHHRVLALNRGERAGRLKLKLKIDYQQASELVYKAVVPEEHPSADFLKKCASEMLSRSLLPSLEREIRREMTESAERHAVEIFANNLRNVLLQPPTRNRTVLAIDPGYKRGCSVALIDRCGNFIESGQVFVVGNQTRREESKTRIRDWVKNHAVDIIAIGNGSACREVEQMVSDTIAEYLSDCQVQYTIVNGAGASVYSTSETGREDLPDLPPAVRSAVSIGRRLQDPLSEMVKIAPANIGVGMYQHDVKAKHLSQSLDDVVEFCVNQVGVDLNTASQALLKNVSGLNALTARRVVEYRAANGRFENREQLKQVSSFGEVTFIQSAGFLRIHGGENPLDATSIHPESYAIAKDILARVDAQAEDIFPRWLMQPARAEIGPKSTSTKPTDNVTTANDTPDVSDQPTSAPADANSPTVSDSGIATAVAHDAPAVDLDSSTGTPPAKSCPPIESNQTDEPSPVDTSSPATDTDTAATSATDTDLGSKSKNIEQNIVSTTNDRRQLDQRKKEILKRLSELDLQAIADAHQAGRMAVKDILRTLKRPAWDPRDKVKKPVFRRGILKVDDLKPEMQLEGQVVNVVDFGVFVDIGLGDSSLVHVSRLSNSYIADPHKVFAVGDTMKVWVTEVSTDQRRVKLTAIKPGAKKPNRRGRDRSDAKASKDQRPSGKPGQPNPGNDRRPGGGRKPGKYDRFRGTNNRQDGRPAKRDVRRSKPKPVKPITDKMLTGDEPMRSFSDLAQFVKQKPSRQKKDSSSDQKKDQ